MRRILKWIGTITFIVAVGGYAGVVGWYRMNEAQFIYQPKKIPAALPENVTGKFQLVEVASTDSVNLVCLMTKAPAKDSTAFWVLYFHGNSGSIFGSLARPEILDSAGANVFSVDYRGYGASTGSPSEQGLYQDARACYDYLTRVIHVPSERVIIYGYSLGSGVATKLATEVKAAGVILEGAFESLPKAGQKDYPYLPLSLMMGQRFSSIDRIDQISVPILVIHGRDDQVVPFSQGQALYEKAVGTKTFLELPGGHSGVTRHRSTFVTAFAEFLATLKLKLARR